MARRVRKLERENAVVTAEMESLRIDLARAQEMLEEERLEVHQRQERQGELARIASQEEEMARERRVLHLQQVAARRISQMELSRGWLTWLTNYEMHARNRRMLRQVAARLSRPKLTASFIEWRRDYELTAVRAKAARARQLLAEQQGEMQENLQARVAMEAELREAREALAHGNSRMDEMERLAAAKEEDRESAQHSRRRR